MSGHWDSYFARVDDKIASFFVDLGLRDRAPDPRLPWVAYVHVRMNSPRDDGLSSQGELDVLSDLEEHLAKCLESEHASYVGRCTTNSNRDFFFYLACADGWAGRVDDCMKAYPAYRYEAGADSDEAWSVYCTYLYPSPAARQSIGNRSVLQSLEKNGDKLTAPREIDHWIDFAEGASRDAFVAAAVELGLRLRSQSDPEPGASGRFSAQIWRTDVPAPDKIDDIVLPLFDLAERFGGKYDGWETSVVR